MNNRTDDPQPDDLRRLGRWEVLDVYAIDGVKGRVRITQEYPLLGELMYDASGRYFLSPEEDERGGGMGAVRVLNLHGSEAFHLVHKLVLVTGMYEASRGLEVETIVLAP